MFNLLEAAVVSQALELMGKGLLGVFSVLIIIALIVWIFSKLDSNKKDKE